jgi:Fur family transcriptional regulator, ferric uptake regulator
MPQATPQPIADSEPSLAIVEPLCAVFRRKLKAEGLKYTPERAQVLHSVLSFDGPFIAERAMDHVREAGFAVSKATMYRTLRLLMDAGIIQRVLVTQDQSYYQVTYGQTPADLIIRLDTGQLIVIDAPELIALRERLCKQHGLTAKGHRLHVFAQAP